MKFVLAPTLKMSGLSNSESKTEDKSPREIIAEECEKAYCPALLDIE
jgi:hypothetical protein